MGARRKVSENREDIITIVLVVISLVAIAAFDILFYPQSNFTILYTIPVLIGALRTSPRAAIVIAAFSVGVDAINAFVFHRAFAA